LDFGFLACQVMRYYSVTHTELLDLPIYTFWELSRNIDRVRADEDRRLLVLFSQAFGGDPNKYLKHLDSQVGSVAEIDRSNAALDKQGLQRLKAMMS